MRKIRQIFFALMTMGLFLGMAPMTAQAAEETTVIVGGTTLSTDTYYKTDANGAITATGSESDYNVKVVKDTTDTTNPKYILTLNDATIAGEYATDDATGVVGGRGYKGIVYNGTDALPLEIKLEGTNKINVLSATENTSTTSTVGIMAANNNLLISGDGTLNISVGTSLLNSHCYGIYVSQGNVVFDSGKIDITTGVVGSGNYYSIAVSASEDENVAGSGTITVNGGTLTTQVATNNTGHIVAFRAQNVVINDGAVTAITGDTNQTNGAIKAYGDITIAGGTVTAIVGDAGHSGNYYNYAINAVGSINISAGTVYANYALENGSVVQKGGGANAENAAGICAEDISISGGKIYAYSGAAKDRVYGIKAGSELKIEGGEITATAGKANHDSCGIYSSQVNISGGTVEATAGDAATQSCGIAANSGISISQDGTNTTSVTAYGGNASNGNSYGIGCVSGSINIYNGTVYAYAKTASGTNATTGTCYGIGSGNTIYMSGGTIVANAYTSETDTANCDSFGIGSTSSIIIKDDASDNISLSITANGGTAKNGNSYGIGTNGNFNVLGAAVIKAKGGKAETGSSFGMGISQSIGSGEFDPSTTGSGCLAIKNGAKVWVEGGHAPSGKSFGSVSVGSTIVDGNGTELKGTGADAGLGSCGVYAGNGLDVSGEGSVQGTAGTGATSVGVGSNADIYVYDNSKLTGTAGASTGSPATNGSATNSSMGIAAGGDFVAGYGSTVIGKGGSSNTNSCGVASNGDIYIEESCTLNAEGGNSTGDSIGLGAMGNVYYINSQIQTTGGNSTGGNSYGTCSEGDIYLEGINSGTLQFTSTAGTCPNGQASLGVGAIGTIYLYGMLNMNTSGNTGAMGAGKVDDDNLDTGIGIIGGDNSNNLSVISDLSTLSTTKLAQSGEVCEISFAGNTGTGTMESVYAIKGNSYSLPECGFTAPANQQFKAWSIGAPATEYAEDAEITVTADTEVTAVWEDITYVVTYDANGGSNTMTAGTATAGQAFTLPANGFDAPQYKKFKAWSIGGTEYAAGATYTFTADTTVSAVWEDITYVVTYDANGGSGTMTVGTATAGQAFTLPANGFTAPVVKEFKCWNIGGTEYAAGDEVDITADTSIKAVWKDKPFTYTMTSIVPEIFKGTGTVVATSNGEFSEFTGVAVNGTEIRKDVDYTAKSGSTIVTLQESYLKTLPVGDYEVKLIYVGGAVTGSFSVEAAPTATPTVAPTATPTVAPTTAPTVAPTTAPTQAPVITQAPAPAVTQAPAYVSPKTGSDSTGMIWIIMLMTMSAGCLVACKRKKN